MIIITLMHTQKRTKIIPFLRFRDIKTSGLCGFSLSSQLTQCHAILFGHVETTEMGKRREYLYPSVVTVWSHLTKMSH